MMYFIVLTGILVLPTLILWTFFRLVTGTWRSEGVNNLDINSHNYQQAHLMEMRKQTEALHQRNLYERGDSIYSYRHKDYNLKNREF